MSSDGPFRRAGLLCLPMHELKRRYLLQQGFVGMFFLVDELFPAAPGKDRGDGVILQQRQVPRPPPGRGCTLNYR